MRSLKCVIKSLYGLRTEEFPNLVNFIQSMKSLAADLTNVNRHRRIRVKPGIRVSNTVERLDGRINHERTSEMQNSPTAMAWSCEDLSLGLNDR